jgi:hypothetical protein
MSKKTDINYIRNFIEKKGGKLLSRVYKDAQSKLEVICENGHIWNPVWTSLRYGHWCFRCQFEKKISESQERLKKIVKEKNGELISGTYKTNCSKLKFRCSNNHVFSSTYRSIASIPKELVDVKAPYTRNESDFKNSDTPSITFTSTNNIMEIVNAQIVKDES